MKFTGNPPAFCFLCQEESAGQHAQLVLALAQTFFRPPPCGDINNRCQDEEPRVSLYRAESNLHGELTAILAAPEEIPSCSHGADYRRGKEATAMSGMLLPKALGHKHLYRLTEHFLF